MRRVVVERRTRESDGFLVFCPFEKNMGAGMLRCLQRSRWGTRMWGPRVDAKIPHVFPSHRPPAIQ